MKATYYLKAGLFLLFDKMVYQYLYTMYMSGQGTLHFITCVTPLLQTLMPAAQALKPFQNTRTF